MSNSKQIGCFYCVFTGKIQDEDCPVCTVSKPPLTEQPVELTSDERCNRFSQWIKDNLNTPYSKMTIAVHSYFDSLGGDTWWGDDPYHDNEAMRAALASATPERESGDVLEALRQAEYVLEHLQPLIKAAGVPPMARKIGVMSGIATSGAHKIKRVLPLLKAAIAGKELPEEEKCGCDGDGLKFNPVTNGWLVCPCKRNQIEGGE